jgi:hypothetical protein
LCIQNKKEDPFCEENLHQDREGILQMLEGAELEKERQNPNVSIGDTIYVQADYMISHLSIISGILSESRPNGFHVSVVYINKINQAMTARAKFTETGWQFVEGQIHQNAGEGLSEFVQRLRAKHNK